MTARKTLIVGWLCFLMPASALGQEVQWRTDYATARKEAEQKGLPLVLDIGTENCYWCRRLDESTFRDQAVVRVMNQQFIPLRVDAHREAQLARLLQVQSYPTIIFAAPSGKILSSFEGYQEPATFHESLQRVLASQDNPDWMQRDYRLASEAVSKGEIARAVTLLRNIVRDGKSRTTQVASQKLLADLEQQAQAKLAKAKQLQQEGSTTAAADLLAALERDCAGLAAARDAGELRRQFAKDADAVNEQRSRRAKELLAQAKKDYQSQQYIPALDRCETLRIHYGDLPEALQALQLTEELRNNPEWLQSACETLSDRLATLYRSLAESWINRGQISQARQCLEQVIRTFPGSRQAEAAQHRLNQLQGEMNRRVEYHPPGQ